MTKAWTPPSDYKGWLAHVFGRPISDTPWYRAASAEADWEPKGSDLLSYLARAFDRPVDEFSAFSDFQIARGLSYLIDPSCSNGIFVLKDATVPQADRQKVVRSMRHLFADLFAKRCAQVLSHLDEKGGSPLNGVCYIWWDVIPLHADPANPAQTGLDSEVLSTMEDSLRIDNLACQESALHGLGHWARSYPERVTTAIDRFLAEHPSLRPELKNYALQARLGRVQ